MDNKKLVIGIITVFFIGVTGLIYCLGKVYKPSKDVILTKDAKREETITSTPKGNKDKDALPDNGDFSLDNENQEDLESSKENSLNETIIYIHVCGEVKNPDVYSLNEGTRVVDAVKKAGGFTKEAAESYINLARVVIDGEQLYIPSLDEVKDMDMIDGKEQTQNQDSSTKSTLVNINTASMEELMTLPGIGESKANSIITYREENGTFKSTEELMNITGIKEGVYKKISDFITVN